MADFKATAAALRSKLQEFTALPLFWPNGNAEPSLSAAPAGYVYSEVHGYAGRQISLGLTGQRESRDEGELEIWVCVPRQSGVGTAEGYAEQIRALFQPTNVAGVTIDRRTIGRGRESGAVNGPSGRVWAVPIVINWYADRTE